MHPLLLITDDWANKKALKSILLERSFQLHVVGSSDLLAEKADLPGKLEVVIVDVERCANDPANVCHAVKRQPPLKELPVILLVPEPLLGRCETTWGFDDYLTLPVSGIRLAERIKFLLWKLHRVSLANGMAQGDLVIDFEQYEVHIKGEPVDLTYKEFELLKFLATHPGKVFTREVLLDKVWGYDFYGGTRTVDVHIRRLRAKLEDHGTVYIETIRNVGYKFLAE